MIRVGGKIVGRKPRAFFEAPIAGQSGFIARQTTSSAGCDLRPGARHAPEPHLINAAVEGRAPIAALADLERRRARLGIARRGQRAIQDTVHIHPEHGPVPVPCNVRPGSRRNTGGADDRTADVAIVPRAEQDLVRRCDAQHVAADAGAAVFFHDGMLHADGRAVDPGFDGDGARNPDTGAVRHVHEVVGPVELKSGGAAREQGNAQKQGGSGDGTPRRTGCFHFSISVWPGSNP